VDGFFDGSTSTSVQRFVTTFEQAYGMKPTILEAQSFDAAKIAIKALQSTGGAHPQDIKATLTNLPDVEGSTGSVGFDSNREPIKKLFLLTVKKENIVELQDSAGQKIPTKDKYGTPIENTPKIDGQKY
jgi:ABC-type branched-subunit amino acid transport system substrate-binding protein